jgi:hypothetical protein
MNYTGKVQHQLKREFYQPKEIFLSTNPLSISSTHFFHIRKKVYSSGKWKALFCLPGLSDFSENRHTACHILFFFTIPIVMTDRTFFYHCAVVILYMLFNHLKRKGTRCHHFTLSPGSEKGFP